MEHLKQIGKVHKIYSKAETKMKKNIYLLALFICASFVITKSSIASTNDIYPNKPIKVIIGFAPGGPTDAIGRVLFSKVSEELKVPMLIENKPGAGGNLGSQELVKSAPDGYTIMYGSSSITTAPPLFGRNDLNPYAYFETVTCTSDVPLMLLVSKKIPVKSAQEFYALLSKNPGKYFSGTSGVGSLDHLIGADIADRLKLKIDYVPYKGNGPALTDVAAGNIDFMYSGAFNSAKPFIERGDVLALAVTSSKRSAELPNVPTLSESVKGLNEFSGGTWQVVLAPKGTPKMYIDKLNHAIRKALIDPAVIKSLNFQSATVMNLSSAECKEFIGSEYARWSNKIKELGITSKTN
jgi:tripartite-type tricarboxylate transporter receptor subunit TctC